MACAVSEWLTIALSERYCGLPKVFRTCKTVTVYKVKVKVTVEQVTKAQRGSRDISTLSLNSALDGVGCQRHASAALPLGKTRYPGAAFGGGKWGDRPRPRS